MPLVLLVAAAVIASPINLASTVDAQGSEPTFSGSFDTKVWETFGADGKIARRLVKV